MHQLAHRGDQPIDRDIAMIDMGLGGRNIDRCFNTVEAVHLLLDAARTTSQVISSRSGWDSY